MKEKLYLFKRRTKALCTKIIYFCGSLRRIDNNKVCVCTFEGRGGFGCSPKYIVEEMHRRSNDYKFYWLVDNMEKEFPNYIIKVQNTFWNRFLHLSNSKLWIDNYRKPYGTWKRKQQIYIQTWHGNIGFKAMGLWRKEGFSRIAYLVSKNDSDMIDYVLNDSEWCREMFPKGMVYDGPFLDTGIPKTDVLFGTTREKLYRKFRIDNNIELDSKIVIYAPTFREKGQKTHRQVYSGDISIDFNALVKSLETKFGGKWYICLKLHPQLAAIMKSFPIDEYSDRFIDMSQADDMNEVLAAMDVCISDYSSVSIDAALVGMPVFLFLDDLDEYSSDRGDMQWIFHGKNDIFATNNTEMTPGIKTQLPFAICRDNDELNCYIAEFNMDKYTNCLSEFWKSVDMIFDGNASCRVVDVIEGIINEKQ